MIDYYEPEIISAADYYPFGMQSRNSLATTSNNYRFGFNGQELDNEIKGWGNAMGAEFWEYDTRIGRRWNRDPIIKGYESPYSAFGNNPIAFVDPDGSDTVTFHKITTRIHLKGSNDGHSDNLVLPHQTVTTQSGNIVIKQAEGDHVFRISSTLIDIDENGKPTITSNTTTLELNNPQTFFRTGGHNVEGFSDDRYALASYAPNWLLEKYDKKSGGDIGIRSAIAQQPLQSFDNQVSGYPARVILTKGYSKEG